MRRALVLALLLTFAFAARAEAVAVKQGQRLGARIFPSDTFTVKDKRQLTGRRVAFRLGRDYPLIDGKRRRRCTNATYSICDAFAQLNKLDGFDLQPRVVVPFTGPIDLESVTDKTVSITTRRGRFASGVRQVTFDPETNTLAGISEAFLRENTRYRVRVTRGVRDAKGKRVKACRRACVSRFTTRTATGQLVRIRRDLDKLPPSTVSFTQDGKDDVFAASSVAPSVAAPLNGIVRADQVLADPQAEGALRESAVPNLIAPGQAGFFAFGSFASPRYQFASPSAERDKPGGGRTDGEIPPVPSRRTPKPLGADRLTAIVVTPDPAQHPPPWPAAVYGPGFTRSAYDIFVSADFNAARGILTVATDPSGHGYGSESTTTVTSNGVPTTFRHFGRGRDLDGDGEIGSGVDDGVGPTGHTQDGGDELPSRKPIDGLRSGLMQTVIDNMVLGRALKAGLDIPGVGENLVDGERISYYGLSFGGIYGTMLLGADPLFQRGLLNVPGGPIVDIARLSSFRGNLADQLARARPALLNGGPGLEGFTEELPLPTEPPRVIEQDGATELQELFAATNWYDRSGSPETFAPLVEPEEVLFQTAYGDGTVPNATAATLYRAGDLFDRVTLYRNDKSPSFASDPHGFLADPTLAGRTPGQQQLVEFLATGTVTNPNPSLFEVPIADPNELECLHYADPQTGETQSRQPFPASGTCPDAR